MPGFLDELDKFIPKTPQYDPNLDTPVKSNFLTELDKFIPKDFSVSSNPQDGPILPVNPEFNTNDFTHINVDQEVLNSGLDNIWNSFKRGIDQIQISTIQGKLNYSPFGDAPYKIKDEYNPNLVKLQEKLRRNELSPEEFAEQKLELDESYRKAIEKIAEGEADIASNEQEILDEPVSKEYDIMSQATQAQGDQASLGDRLKYSAPGIVGSSASLMGYQLAATFGSNITKALIKSSAAHLLGPELGVPANVIATIGAMGMSVAELMYGRHQESMGEIGSTIMDAQKKMLQTYMSKNNITSEDEVPEEVKRDIRIKSRQGADMQYKENMSLAANDIISAMVMPMSNLGSGLGTLSRAANDISRGVSAAKNYSKLTRTLSTLGRLGVNNYLEKFEEGSQYAMQKRAEDAIYGTNKYVNDGFLKNILEDSYDTINSLNLSIIPGIDARGDGRYAEDEEFQFSENSGGMLATLMGGLPTAISIAQDMRAYKAASKDLQSNGIVNIDGKFSRIDNTILAKYFDKDLRENRGRFSPSGETHHLISAIKSLTTKKDENGNPIIDPDKATELIQSIKDKQELYSSIASRIDSRVSNDKMFGKSPELRSAIQLAKLETFNTANEIVERNKRVDTLASDIDILSSKENRLYGNPEFKDRQNLEAKLEALKEMKAAQLKAQYDLSRSEHLAASYGRDSLQENISRSLIYLESDIKDTEKMLAAEEKAYKGVGLEEDYVAPSDSLKNLHKESVANDIFLSDSKSKYAELNKIKNKKDLLEYYQKNSTKLTENVLEEEEVPEETVPEENVRDTPPRDSNDIDADKDLTQAPTSNPNPTTTEEAASTSASTSVPVPFKGAIADKAKLLNISRDEILEYLRDTANQANSIASRIDALKKFLHVADLQASFPDDLGAHVLATVMRDELGMDDKSIADIISRIQEIAVMLNKDVPVFKFLADKYPDGTFKLGWIEEASVIPPMQNDESVDRNNSDVVMNYRDTPGTNLKITSGMSLAGRHIEGKLTEEGKWYDEFSNNKLRFSEEDHQQLVNTNLINEGDTFSVRAEFSENFNSSDESDYNFDQVKIGVYKTVTLPGGLSRELLINYLHRVDKLKELLAQSKDSSGNLIVNIAEEEGLLRNARTNIIRAGKGAEFTMTASKKGFGFLNRNSNSTFTTVANAIGEDSRPLISYVDTNGKPYSFNKTVLSAKKPLSQGATVLLLPNNTGMGTVYIPLYLSKKKLGVDPSIHKKVSDSVLEYLNKDGIHTQYLTEAKKYVFISNHSDSLKALGLAGVYVPTDATEATIIINNTKYTKANADQVVEALKSVYFSVNREHLEDEAYQKELKFSPVLQTTITPNQVILDRVKTGDYNFLEGDERYSYFSQHTIVLGDLTRVDAPIIETDVEVPSDARAYARSWFEALAKIDPMDQSIENAEKVNELRKRLPEGITSTDVNTLLAMRGDYTEVPAYRFAFPEKFTQDTSIQDSNIDENLLDELDEFPDLEDPMLESRKNNLLVSDQISGTLQNEMVESIAYKLFTNTKETDTDITNSDKVKSEMMTSLDKFRKQYNALTEAKSNPERWVELKSPDKQYNALGKLITNYSLMIENWTELVKRARKFLSLMGEDTSEEDDYYESDDREDNIFAEYNDDSNRTRNEMDHLSKNAKRLLNFIPKVEPTTEADRKKDPTKLYKEVKNQLLLSTFNNINDSWSKILGVTTGVNKKKARFFDATVSGLADMIEALRDTENPPVVTIFADKLAKAPLQVQKNIFRKIRLTYQKNETGVSYNFVKPLIDRQSGTKIGEGEYTDFRTSASDKRQGVRNVVEELTSEMLNKEGSQLFVPVYDETTNLTTTRIDSKYAEELLEEMNNIIGDRQSDNYDYRITGDIKEYYTTLSELGKDRIYSILKDKMGINMSRLAFNKMLQYHMADARKPNHEIAIRNIIGNILSSYKNADKDSRYKSIKNAESVHVFFNQTSSINVIANFEFQFRVQRSSGSYRMGKKSYYPYVRGNYLSDFFLQLRDKVNGGPGYFIDEKKNYDDYANVEGGIINQVFNGNSEFVNSFDVSSELGARTQGSDQDAKMLSEMTPREHKLTKYKSFQNRNARPARFFFDTLSDKTTKPKVTHNRRDIGYDFSSRIDANNVVMSDSNLEQMYKFFEAEMRRVNNVRTQNTTLPAHKLIKGYHDRGKNEGVGKYFLGFHFMNKAVLDVDNPNLSRILYNDNGDMRVINDQVKAQIKTHFNSHLNKIFRDLKNDARNNDMFTIEPKVNEQGIAYTEIDIKDILDHKYLTDELSFRSNTVHKNPGVMVKLGILANNNSRNTMLDGNYSILSADEAHRVVDYAIIDYGFNYLMYTLDMWTITGDPAQAGKPLSAKGMQAIRDKYVTDPKLGEKYVILANVMSTFDNLYKRNASFVASGDVGVWDKDYYNVSIAKDISIDSPELEQYKSLFPDNVNGIVKAYNDGDLTDAQEITTVEEDLDQQLAYGIISELQHRQGLYVYDREAYTERYGEGEETLSTLDRVELHKVIFQPKKPVQRTYVIDKELRMSKQFYIKTSSFPLIPSMLSGAMLDLLNDMKKNKVQRVAFVSGVKQGVAGEKALFNNDGTYNQSFFENNINQLHRNGFRIQLEVPFKEYKEDIREGTQKSKLLFVDLPHDLEMMLGEEKKTVGELNTMYTAIHDRILDIKKRELFKELGAREDESGRVSLTRNFFKNLSDMLKREGEGRGYAMNSLLGLELNDKGQFTIPLTFLPNAAQMEPVITSIVSNRMTRLRMSGKSGIQASEFLLRTGIPKEDVIDGTDLKAIKDTRSIVWTKPEYANLEKLRYMRVMDPNNELYMGSADNIPQGSTIQYAQVLISPHLIDPRRKDREGHARKIDIKDYINSDGFLDLNKIDPELLQLNGFRIPFQGHNSAMWFEIVGFLPDATGDMIVVPGEIAAQMGSDYDVDKLYYYLYNYHFDSANNVYKINSSTKLPETKSEEGINPSSLEELTESELELKSLQNSLMDIEKAVLTSPYAVKAILDPLSFSDVEDTIEYFGGSTQVEFYGAMSPKYQDDVYFSNITGKLGVGISANNNTSHALAQQANLFIKGDGIRFLDEKGNTYSDFIPNSKTSSNTNISDKAKMFEQAVRTYIGDFGGHDNEYYTEELEVARKIINSIAWTEQTLSSPDYIKLQTLISEAEVLVSSEDLSEAHNSVAAVMYHLVNMVKINNPADRDIIEASNILSNPNGTTRTYNYTYTYMSGDTLEDANKASNQSAWRLDKIYTFPDPVTGRRYNISNMISQILGISVDNAKEQKLGAFGINEHNFNTALTIMRTGFSLNWVYAFINQPILKEYYKAIGGLSDIYDMSSDRFTPNRREQIVKDMFDKYSDIYNVNNTYEEEGIIGFSFNDLSSNLKMNTISVQNVSQQLHILKAYLKYKDIADKLQDLSSVINIDTKGAPKDMSSNIEKNKRLDDIRNSELLGNIDNYVARTIPGLFVDVPQMVIDLFMNDSKPVFAYNSDAYQYALEAIKDSTDKNKLGEDQLNSIYSSIKQYIYSGFVFSDGETITQARERLLFGDTSIQARVGALQTLPIHKGNDWLESIRPVSSITPEDPRLIYVNFSADDEFIARVSELWESALYDDKNPDLQAFAKDLVKYALYVSPKEYGVSSIIKYVPISYLKSIGFADYLNDINNRTNDSPIDSNSGAVLTSRLPRQFIQHNVDFLFTVRPEKQAVKYSTKYLKAANGHNIVLNSFILPRITDNNKDNPARSLIKGIADKRHYPRYLAAFIDDIYGKQIYEGQMNIDGTVTYYRIDKLGSLNSSEYDMNRDASTNFGPTSKSNVIIPTTGISSIPSTPAPAQDNLIESNPKKDLTSKDYLNPENNADEILEAIISKNSNLPSSFTDTEKKYANYYKFLAQTMQYKGLKDASLTFDSNIKSAGLTSTREGKITVNFNVDAMKKGRTGLKGELERQRTVLHEFIHVLVHQKVKGISKDSKELRDVFDVWQQYRRNVANTKEKVRGISQGALNAEFFTIIKQRFDDSRGMRDLGTNFGEYVDRVLSNDEDLESVLEQVSDNLRVLAVNNVIPQVDFNLSSNQERLADIKAHIKGVFTNDLTAQADKYYAYFSVHEFVTESMTNRHTQKLLQSMPSMWEKLVSAIKDIVAKILGIENEERTLFNDAFDSIYKLLDLGEVKMGSMKFEEEPSSGYAERTRKNASADATIAIAVDFNSAGERLTKSSVQGQGKKYISLDFNNPNITQDRVDKIVDELNSVNAKTLNIAGNGIYTMKGRYTQNQVDDFTYELLKRVMTSPRLKNKIVSVRTGGQTGFDEAGAKAAMRLGIDTLVLAPKGWKFRNIDGIDISSESQFKNRFGNVLPDQGTLFDESFVQSNKNKLGFKKGPCK